jgi:hypothetical protein
MTSRRKSGYVGEGLSLPASPPLEAETLEAAVAGLADLDAARLRLQWRNHLGGSAPAHLPRWLLLRVLVHRMQVVVLGDLDKAMRQLLRPSKDQALGLPRVPFETRRPATREGISLKPGALLVREWKGRRERVMVLDNGFATLKSTEKRVARVETSPPGRPRADRRRRLVGVCAELHPNASGLETGSQMAHNAMCQMPRPTPSM